MPICSVATFSDEVEQNLMFDPNAGFLAILHSLWKHLTSGVSSDIKKATSKAKFWSVNN